MAFLILTIMKMVKLQIEHQFLKQEIKLIFQFFLGCWKSYSSNHNLIRLTESWKKFLDQKQFVGAVLMDISKAFDSIPHDFIARMHDLIARMHDFIARMHDLIARMHDFIARMHDLIARVYDFIARMHACGFSRNYLLFFYSYLKRRRQIVSILGPILFDIFINNLLLWISNSEVLSFADDSTIWAAASTIEELSTTVEKESQAANAWFKLNEMFVNLDKFHAIIVKRNNIRNDSYPLNTNQDVIN